MNNKQKNKPSIFFILGIVFGAIGIICFIMNLIYIISSISAYVAYGYSVWTMISSSIYSIFQPLEVFGGVSAILFALNAIINRLPAPAAAQSEDAGTAKEPGITDESK